MLALVAKAQTVAAVDDGEAGLCMSSFLLAGKL
jgi:hypothetical protein